MLDLSEFYLFLDFQTTPTELTPGPGLRESLLEVLRRSYVLLGIEPGFGHMHGAHSTLSDPLTKQ